MSQVVQDERRERLTRIVAAASLVASAIYIVWRWGWTIDTEALWFSVPLALAETYGVLAAALLTGTAWKLSRREPPAALPDRTVDVFVTVANEPLATIRKTALAAREIRYPHTTWLLDDGERDELRTVAEEIGIRYLRRAEHSHGKAGNLNHALGQSSGEFILQLDADHVALPQIVDRMLGFFADDGIAFVQSPQDFYNTDAFNDDAGPQQRQLWGDQQLFFNVLQPGKDRANAAIFVGSCAMLRRTALLDVGGFGTHTATMGTETSLQLHARGWRSAYVNENLAFGLAPATAHAYQVQQLHRAQGGMQLLRHAQPLAQAGLTTAQRIAYFDTLSTPLGSVQRLVLYLTPIAFLTTGVFPVRASVGMFAVFFVPMVLLRATAFRLLARGNGSLLRTDRYWMAKFFSHLISVRAFFTPGRLQFRPRANEAGAVPLRTVAPQLVLLGMTVAALAWATYARTLGYSAEVPGWGLLALFGAVGLALWHAALAAHVVQLSLAGRHRRVEHRFAESLSVGLRVMRADGKLSSTDIAITEDLTATGLALRCMYPIPHGARVELTLPLSSGEVQVRGRVVRHATSETQLGTVHRAGVEFDATSREARDAIELHCAQHAMPIEQQRQRQSAASARMRNLRGERRVEVGMPARVISGEGDAAVELGVGLLEDVSPRGGRVLLDHPVAEGTLLTLQIPGSAVRASGHVVFVHAMETGLGMRFVAGFQSPVDPAAAVAPAPWYAAILRLAARTSTAAAAGSATAAGLVVQGSRTAAGKLAETSQEATRRLAATTRVAADKLAQGSRVTVEKVSVATRVAGERLAAESRVAVSRAADAARASRAALAAARAGKAGGSAQVVAPTAIPMGTEDADDGVERISLAPMAEEARVRRESIATNAAALAAALEAQEAALAADAPFMEPVATGMGPVDAPGAVAGDPDRAVEMEIDGEFSFPFELTVGATLLITESGRVAADIATVHAVVLGRYTGSLRATGSIRVGPRAQVDGLLEAPEVRIDDGAVVNGLVAGAVEPAVAAVAQVEAAHDLPAPASSSPVEAPTSVPEAASAEQPVAAATDEPASPAPPVAAADETPEEEIFVASPIFTEGVSRG